ncbi:glycosyltransferase family 4 protein [Parabacteroides sp.]
MKILMLTTNSSLMDGINRHILTLAPALNDMSGVEVSVCTVLPYGDLNRALEDRGVRCYSLNSPHGHDWHILPRFYKVISEYDPSIIHIHVLAMMERLLCATLFRQKKYVCTVHGISDKVTHYTLCMRMELLLNKLFQIPYSATCYISEGVKQALFKPSKKAFCSPVIYNPIGFEETVSSSYALHKLIGVGKDVPVIGTSCRIAAVKNPQLFTEVMCKVLLSDRNVHAVVMGDGDRGLMGTCGMIVKRYGLEERFHWLGYRADAPSLVQDLSCFIMTSHSEGLPTSLLECMAMKTPIAFLKGKGGLIDMAQLNEREGVFAITAAYDEWERLAEGIVELIHDPEKPREYAEQAYMIGKRHFSIDQVANRLADLYQSIL